MSDQHDDGPLLTTTEAAAVARRRPDTISQWRTRGRLVPADVDARGRPLYRYGAVLAAERAARNRDDTGRALQALHGA